MVKHLIETYDIDIFPVNGIDRRRTDDVVQHGISVDRIVQEFPDPEHIQGRETAPEIIHENDKTSWQIRWYSVGKCLVHILISG